MSNKSVSPRGNRHSVEFEHNALLMFGAFVMFAVQIYSLIHERHGSNKGISASAPFSYSFLLKGSAECVYIYSAQRSIFTILPCKANIRTIRAMQKQKEKEKKTTTTTTLWHSLNKLQKYKTKKYSAHIVPLHRVI